jgi:hypothetical protein
VTISDRRIDGGPGPFILKDRKCPLLLLNGVHVVEVRAKSTHLPNGLLGLGRVAGVENTTVVNCLVVAIVQFFSHHTALNPLGTLMLMFLGCEHRITLGTHEHPLFEEFSSSLILDASQSGLVGSGVEMVGGWIIGGVQQTILQHYGKELMGEGDVV